MAPKNIVLIHGWGAESAKLMPLANELKNLGWQVLIPKLAGFERPAPRTVWGIKDYSDYVFEKAQAEFGKTKFFVFGHSFGGGIAIKLAGENSKNLEGVILCATRGVSRTVSVKRLVFATLAKTGKVLLITPRLADNFKKLLYKAAREHDYEKTRGIMKDVFKKIISEDLKPFIAKIKIPTLILWGGKDKTTPLKDARYIKSILPGSGFISYPDQGHKLPYDKPREIAGEIEKWYKQI